MYSTYDVVNGFLGMETYIIIQLVNLLEEKILVTTVMGMCVENFVLRNCSVFVNSRKKNIPHSFRVNPKGGCIITRTSFGKKCTFNQEEWYRSIFLNPTIIKGLLHWSVQIDYGTGNDFSIGGAASNCLSRLDTLYFCCHREKACGFNFYVSGVKLYSHLDNADDFGARYSFEETPVPNNSVVAAEVDFTLRTLTFFVNNKKVPRGISQIPVPFSLGMCSTRIGGSFTSLSLRRLAYATPSSIACTYYGFRDDAWHQRNDESNRREEEEERRKKKRK